VSIIYEKTSVPEVKYYIDFTQIILEYLLIVVSFLDNIFIRFGDKV